MNILIVSSVVCAAILVATFLLVRYPRILDYLPIIRWSLRLIYDTLTFWEVKVKYRNSANLALKFSVVIEAVHFSKANPRLARAWIAKFVKDTRELVEGYNFTDEEAEKAANAISMLLSHHPTLLETISTFEKTDTLDIKGLTVIFIDVLGELYDLKDELDKSMFEHLIVAINRSLLMLKKEGYSSKAYEEIGFIMLRLRRVCQAHNEQKKLRKLTIGELHDVVDDAIASLHKVLTWKNTSDK